MATHRRHPEPVRNLSACYQEALTATARLMSRSHELPDAATFRSRILTLLKYAESQAAQAGFDAGDIGPASFAVVALVDEAAMNSGLGLVDNGMVRSVSVRVGGRRRRPSPGGARFAPGVFQLQSRGPQIVR